MTPARKIIFGLILSAACAALSAATLATVNGEDIDSRIIEYNAKSLAENEGMADTPELRRELLRLHVVATVVSQQARQLKLDESAEFRQMRQKLLDKLAAQIDEKNPEFGIERLIIEKNLLNDAYARYVAQKNPAREKDARALYDNLRQSTQGEQQVQLARIATRSRKEAQQAIAELDAGRSFADVAKKYLPAKTDQTFTLLTDMEKQAPELHAAIKNLKKGEFTHAPLHENGLYYIIRVNDRKAFQLAPYDEMKATIAEQLQADQFNQAVRELVMQADIQYAR